MVHVANLTLPNVVSNSNNFHSHRIKCPVIPFLQFFSVPLSIKPYSHNNVGDNTMNCMDMPVAICSPDFFTDSTSLDDLMFWMM